MNPWMSESIDKLAPALLAAQMKLAPVMKEFRNPAFPKSKYADLNAVLEAVNDAFHPNGLMLTQLPMPLHGPSGVVGLTVKTVVMHTSGQWVASDLPMCPDMSNPQKVGGCVTYGRRYGAVAAAGLMQEDDDGETATHGRDRNPECTARSTSEAPGPAQPVANGDGQKSYPAPRHGGALFAWAKEQGQRFDVDVVKWLGQWGKLQNLPGNFKEWAPGEVTEGYNAAVAKLNRHVTGTVGVSEDQE